MNLRSLDLNLLVILDALLDEAHVTRAAQRLALSQPATSSALERCRHVFKDRLLERGQGGRMTLTPAAQALRAPLKRALVAITEVVGAETPDLATLRQSVRIVMADLPGTLVAAPLYRALQDSAPGVQALLMAWRSNDDALQALASGAADIVVSVVPPVAGALHREELIREEYRVAMRAGHPAARCFGLDAWLDYPHVVVSSRGEATGALDAALAEIGRERRVGMVVPLFAQVGPLLADSDLIAMLPARSLRPPHGAGLVHFAPPIAVDGFALSMAWHERRDTDPGVRHVRQLLAGLVRAI